MPTEPLRLITIPPSHYSEKARWALDRARIRFREEGHVPGFHVVHVRRAGGYHSVPVLVTPQGSLADSTDILRWVDTHAARPGLLYGDDPALSRDIASLEDHFDTRFGQHVIRVAYSFLLPERKLILDTLAHGVPFAERALVAASYSFIVGPFSRRLDLSPAGVEKSRTRIGQAFDLVAERLADGRRYLAGDAFSAADLTFAALSGPLVLPTQYGSYFPPEHHLPPHVRAIRDQFRDTVAGRFAMRMYEQERHA